MDSDNISTNDTRSGIDDDSYDYLKKKCIFEKYKIDMANIIVEDIRHNINRLINQENDYIEVFNIVKRTVMSYKIDYDVLHRAIKLSILDLAISCIDISYIQTFRKFFGNYLFFFIRDGSKKHQIKAGVKLLYSKQGLYRPSRILRNSILIWSLNINKWNYEPEEKDFKDVLKMFETREGRNIYELKKLIRIKYEGLSGYKEDYFPAFLTGIIIHCWRKKQVRILNSIFKKFEVDLELENSEDLYETFNIDVNLDSNIEENIYNNNDLNEKAYLHSEENIQIYLTNKNFNKNSCSLIYSGLQIKKKLGSNLNKTLLINNFTNEYLKEEDILNYIERLDSILNQYELYINELPEAIIYCLLDLLISTSNEREIYEFELVFTKVRKYIFSNKIIPSSFTINKTLINAGIELIVTHHAKIYPDRMLRNCFLLWTLNTDYINYVFDASNFKYVIDPIISKIYKTEDECYERLINQNKNTKIVEFMKKKSFPAFLMLLFIDLNISKEKESFDKLFNFVCSTNYEIINSNNDIKYNENELLLSDNQNEFIDDCIPFYD